MYNYIMMSHLHTKFHDNWISSFRGGAMSRFWDGVTRLLDQLSPLATQVKMAAICELCKCYDCDDYKYLPT